MNTFGGPCSRFPQAMRAAEPYSAAADSKLAMLQTLLGETERLVGREPTPDECRSLQLHVMQINNDLGAEIDCEIDFVRDEPEAVARQIEAEIEKLEHVR